MKDKKKGGDYITINLLPASILLAAIIISGTLLYTQENKKLSTQDTSNGETQGEQTTNETESGFKQVTVNIDDDPILGDKDNAAVAVVEFSEYQCGYCKKFTDEIFPSIKENYIDTEKIVYVFRDFQMYGEVSETIAKLGECVNEQYGIDKFLEYHTSAFGLSAVDDGYNLVSKMGLDLNKVKTCSQSDSLTEEIAKDMTEGKAIGMEGTPGFVIGKLDKDGNVKGQLIPGAYPYSEFEKVINEYL